MSVLNDTHQKLMQDALTRITKGIELIAFTVDKYNLPHAYTQAEEYLNKQRLAIKNLIATGQLGCTIEELEVKEDLVEKQDHLENLSAAVEWVKSNVSDAEQPKALHDAVQFLHDIKGTVSGVVSYGIGDIQKVIEERAHARAGSGFNPLPPSR